MFVVQVVSAAGIAGIAGKFSDEGRAGSCFLEWCRNAITIFGLRRSVLRVRFVQAGRIQSEFAPSEGCS